MLTFESSMTLDMIITGRLNTSTENWMSGRIECIVFENTVDNAVCYNVVQILACPDYNVVQILACPDYRVLKTDNTTKGF
jgi:hypothetical protein